MATYQKDDAALAPAVFDTTHLKQGKAYFDRIATAKATGTHFTDSASEVRITRTPASAPGVSDGKLGGKNSPDGRQGWANMNPTTADNTYTGKGGSKRD
jgi:hypothetical protein